MFHSLRGVELLLVAAASISCACAGSRSQRAHGEQAAGGENAGNSAGAAGNSNEPEPVTDSPLAPGSCGVVRRIEVPGGPRLDDIVMRQDGGFSLGPKPSSDREGQIDAYLFRDAERRWRTFTASGSPNDNHWSFMFGAGPKLAEVYVGPLGIEEETFGLRLWSDGDETAQEPGALLRARWRGTDTILVRPSFDGEHAVFAIWPSALSEPRAAHFGADGARIGEALSLAPSEHRYSACERLTPTTHGGIVSFVDTDDATWHLRELGATGTAVEVSQPWPSTRRACPLLSLDASGIWYLAPTADGAPTFQLSHADGASSPTGTQVTLRGSPEAFTSTPRGTLVLERVDNRLSLELLAPDRTQSFELEDEFGVIAVIPSEPGRLFIDAQELGGPRRIVELGCR